MKYIVQHCAIFHQGVRYEVGEEIELPEKHAKQLSYYLKSLEDEKSMPNLENNLEEFEQSESEQSVIDEESKQLSLEKEKQAGSKKGRKKADQTE